MSKQFTLPIVTPTHAAWTSQLAWNSSLIIEYAKFLVSTEV